jgi:hypothetical protein
MTMPDPSQSALPPLPEPSYAVNNVEKRYYTADQMRAYALAALAAQPQAEPSSATVPSDEQKAFNDWYMNAPEGQLSLHGAWKARAVLALAAPAQLPESMGRDEMLKYYRDYANVQSNEALRYQKRIRDLEALAAPAVQADLPRYCRCNHGDESDPEFCRNCGLHREPSEAEPAAQSADAVNDTVRLEWVMGVYGIPGSRATIDAAMKLTTADAAISQSAAAAKAEPAEAGCAACGTGER